MLGARWSKRKFGFVREARVFRERGKHRLRQRSKAIGDRRWERVWLRGQGGVGG